MGGLVIKKVRNSIAVAYYKACPANLSNIAVARRITWHEMCSSLETAFDAYSFLLLLTGDRTMPRS